MGSQELKCPLDNGGVSLLVEELQQADTSATVEIEGHSVAFTNLAKPMWPETAESPVLTKRDFLVYLAEASPYLLPHLRDRPLTTIRLPNGITGQRFFQKHAIGSPSFLAKALLLARTAGEEHEYLVCNNLASLMWLGQLASLELHASYARVVPEPDAAHLGADHDRLFDYPDFLIFDLDPYIYSGDEAKGDEPALNRPAFARTCEVALWLKELLDGLGLPSFVKTTGKTGLHIFVPILREVDYAATRAIAETIALHVVRLHRRDVTTEWTIPKRSGKIFIDINQNVRAKTVAAIYSPRSTPEAAVSMPLRWDELGSVYPTDFTIRNAGARLQTMGDLWSGILQAKTDILAALK